MYRAIVADSTITLDWVNRAGAFGIEWILRKGSDFSVGKSIRTTSILNPQASAVNWQRISGNVYLKLYRIGFERSDIFLLVLKIF
jgi:hypothetical protein